MKHFKILDSKHLFSVCSRLEDCRIVPPNTNLLSFPFGACGYVIVFNVVEFFCDFGRTISIRNSGYTINLDLIDDVRTEFSNRQPRKGNDTISIPNGVVPFLSRFGKCIREIKLYLITDVYIFALMSSCPLLRIVEFNVCDFKNSSQPPPPFPRFLEIYKLFCSKTLGFDVLVYWLMSPCLKDISVTECPAFCDGALENAFRQHRFKTLERLRIENCKRVSKSVFNSCFMSESDALCFAKLRKCPNMGTMENRREWL